MGYVVFGREPRARAEYSQIFEEILDVCVRIHKCDTLMQKTERKCQLFFDFLKKPLDRCMCIYRCIYGAEEQDD